MKAGNIHPVRIAFGIPVSPDKTVERFVYAYALDGDRLCLIDTGVAGAEKIISTALQKIGKNLSDIDLIILTHSHPDHIGSACLTQRQSGAQVWAHRNEQVWIENTDRQGRERPVPGFAKLVSGSVTINRLLSDGDILSLGKDLTFRVLHTPGHSSGSISLLSEENGILFCGDVIPQPGGMPIYEDVSALANSLVRLAEIENLTALYSSWADPLYGQSAVDAICAGIRYLKTIHTVMLSYYPWWIVQLYHIRKLLAGLLGLVKHEAPEQLPNLQPEDVSFTPGENVTFFIVRCAKEDTFWVSETPDDKHLRAYFAVIKEPVSNSTNRFYVVTAVFYKHWTGPVYFNLIRPFHHLVVSRMARYGLRH